MTALDVLAEQVKHLGPHRGAVADQALADLEALVEAAKGWEAAEPWGDEPDQCDHVGCICAEENELRAALARVLGTEQDTA